jgi:WD40 repeat protein
MRAQNYRRVRGFRRAGVVAKFSVQAMKAAREAPEVKSVDDVHKGLISFVSFNPNGTLIATAPDDKVVKLVSVPAVGDVVLHLPGLHEGSVTGVSFSPDGTLLATSSDDKSVKLTSVADGKVVLHLPELHKGDTWGLDFSSDGKFLAAGSADKSVKLLSMSETIC